jgi:hypothetical protein
MESTIRSISRRARAVSSVDGSTVAARMGLRSAIRDLRMHSLRTIWNIHAASAASARSVPIFGTGRSRPPALRALHPRAWSREYGRSDARVHGSRRGVSRSRGDRPVGLLQGGADDVTRREEFDHDRRPAFHKELRVAAGSKEWLYRCRLLYAIAYEAHDADSATAAGPRTARPSTVRHVDILRA